MILIKRVSPGYYLAGQGYNKGVVHAEVEGHTVVLREGKGWLCFCDQPDCEHIAAVAALIHPHTIATITTRLRRERKKTK